MTEGRGVNTPEKIDFAPGARVEIRDAEWVIRRVDSTSDHGKQLTCEGVSELVSGKEGIFLTKLEDEIRVLDPVHTKLVQDLSPRFQKSLLYIESQLRRSTPSDQRIHVAHLAAMDKVDYQIEAAVQALKQPRQRILIADGVGLGKTLEAGILTTELMARGRGKRILVLALKSMLTQFQKEFWNRFSIPLTRLDSAGLQRVRSRIPGNHNPFYYYDQSIISIDTLKQDNEFKTYLEDAYWDIIIIDEAHNVADRGTSSQRKQLAQLLAKRSDTLIMLSATPHDGRAKSFASLMNMLDPTAIGDVENYAEADFKEKGLLVRRFKKDIKGQVASNKFKDRRLINLSHEASLEEEAAYEALLNVPFTYRGVHDETTNGSLVRVGLQKALFSSPFACIRSIEERGKTLADKYDNSDIQAELNGLASLEAHLKKITNSNWAKYQHLLKTLKDKSVGWRKTQSEDRLVIFSERIETLKHLERSLKQDLALKDEQIVMLYGGLSDTEQQDLVEAFGNASSKVRVMLCSDVASEGINLHYLSHRLIHFDLPWSLMTFQQRNGRVDRYGQKHNPEIYFMVTRSQNEIIRGDTRTLEILLEKEQQAYDNIGDPATIMDLFDAEEEEKAIAEVIANGATPEEIEKLLKIDNSVDNEGDRLMGLFLDDDHAKKHNQDLVLVESFSLFSDEFDFAEAALNVLNKDRRRVQVSSNRANGAISLVAPQDLKERFRFLPSEIYPKDGVFKLTQNVDEYNDEIDRSRNDPNAWPDLHYLWRRHPVMDWLQDQMLTNTGRHEALVLDFSTELGTDESIFLASALIPNRKSHPVIWDWYGVHCKDGQITKVEPMDELLTRFKFDTRNHTNPAKPINLSNLEALRAQVVAAVEGEVGKARERFMSVNDPLLEQQLENLSALKSKQSSQLALWYESSQELPTRKDTKKMQRQQQIETDFQDYQKWIEDTMRIESKPYIQLIAVLAGAQN